MSSQLEWIDQQLSQAGVLVSTYIIEHGIPHEQIQKFIDNGDIERITIGLYAKKKGPISWENILNAIQNQMRLPVRISGLTSLALQGVVEQPENAKIQLISNQFVKLPKWAHGQEWSVVHKVSRLFEQNKNNDIVEVNVGGHPLKVSRIELAMLELIEQVTDEKRFAAALVVMKCLTSVNVEYLQSLLERSESPKANRLFLHYAHKCKHAWIKDVNEATIDLGNDEIQVIKDGILDGNYNITVPAFYPA